MRKFKADFFFKLFREADETQQYLALEWKEANFWIWMARGDMVVVEKRKDRFREGESFAGLVFAIPIAGLTVTYEWVNSLGSVSCVINLPGSSLEPAGFLVSTILVGQLLKNVTFLMVGNCFWKVVRKWSEESLEKYQLSKKWWSAQMVRPIKREPSRDILIPLLL